MAKKAGCVWSVISLILFAAVLVMGVREGMEGDARLSAFCSSIPVGASLENARSQAIAQGFVASDATSEPPQPGINVYAQLSFWPRSWCRFDHDGSSITRQSFNPWYE